MGLMYVVIIFAGLIAWIAKVAEARGRIALGWAAAAAAIGAAAFLLGTEIVDRVMGDTEADGIALFSLLAPLAIMAVSMTTIALVLYRLPIKTSLRRRFPVDNITGGASGDRGSFAIGADSVRLEFSSGAQVIPLAAFRTVNSDGECLRLSWDAGGESREAMLLPRGMPDNPAGRKQQSRAIEKRLRGHMPRATMVLRNREK